MEELDPTTPVFWLSVGTAIACGTIVGLDRQLRGKAVGVRTSCLICLGTEIFVQVGRLAGSGGADPTRVLGQIVTGVGFLGAGVILARRGAVMGVTTAAVIWVLAGIGAAIGFGALEAALVFSVLIVALLNGVDWLERMFQRLRGSPPESD